MLPVGTALLSVSSFFNEPVSVLGPPSVSSLIFVDPHTGHLGPFFIINPLFFCCTTTPASWTKKYHFFWLYAICGFFFKWLRHSFFYFQLEPSKFLATIHEGRGCAFFKDKLSLSQLGHFAALFSSSYTRNARPQSLHSYSLPGIIWPPCLFYYYEYIVLYRQCAVIYIDLHPPWLKYYLVFFSVSGAFHAHLCL